MLSCVFSVRQMVASNSKSLPSAGENIFSSHIKPGGRWLRLHTVAIFILPGIFSSALPSSGSLVIIFWHHCCCPPWLSEKKMESYHVRWLCKASPISPEIVEALLGRLHKVPCGGPLASVPLYPLRLMRSQRKWCNRACLSQFILWDWGWFPLRSVWLDWRGMVRNLTNTWSQS